jgi:hypothetical protein
MRLRAAIACLATVVPLAAFAESSIARFEGGIGSHPNTPVLGTASGGQPWVIANLSADVKSDGRISVAGRGLLLGGGGNIGRNGGQSVHARLFCNGVSQDTATNVPLEDDGDFRIDESFAVPPPNPCVNPILLIVNVNGSWFAAGIPKN